MFSTLNNLVDISLDVNAGTLGYTESEVRAFFCNHIKALKAELNIQNDDNDDVMNILRET